MFNWCTANLKLPWRLNAKYQSVYLILYSIIYLFLNRTYCPFNDIIFLIFNYF